MLRWFLVFLVVATTLAVPAREPYGLGVVDELKLLDRTALEQAARPLLQRGAAVAIVLARHGDRQDAVRQLSQLGLLSGRQISPAGLYLYVSLEPHYSELRAGSRFSEDLPPSRLEKIREQSLNPQLQGERYQQGFTDALAALEQSLSHSLSLKDWLGRATLAFIAFGMLYLLGFWDWFCGTPPGRGVLWLWSLTPMARARQRLELEKARFRQLQLLQERAEALVKTRQDPTVLSPARKADLDSLLQQVKAASSLASPQLVELRTRVEAETSRLEQLQRHRHSGTRELVEAQQLFQAIRSALKARKKTRALLQSPEMQALEAELKQESELRRGYSEDETGLEEYQLSEQRCQALHRRARELASIHGALKKSPAQPQANWSSSSESASGYSPPGSSSEERGSNYDPPTSSSESWAGGSW